MIAFDKVAFGQGDFELRADVQIASQSITAVIGPSGSGKSTFLSLAAGFARPDAGRVLIGGKDVTDAAPGDRPVSMLFQDANLFPHMDIATNVALGVSPSANAKGPHRDAIASVLERVGLDGLGSRKPKDVSGGQQSRAALARALLRKRPVVLLDEPFAALGPALRAEMLDLVAEVFANVTVLMVTHAPEDAKRIAAHTIVVDQGHVAQPLPTDALFDAPTAALKRYLG